MAAAAITLDDLMGALRDAGFTGADNTEGKTIIELCEEWKCSKTYALKVVREAKSRGMLRAGWRRTERVDGQMCNVPVYAFVYEKPKRGKKR